MILFSQATFLISLAFPLTSRVFMNEQYPRRRQKPKMREESLAWYINFRNKIDKKLPFEEYGKE